MSEPPRIWKTGERCRISYEGRTVEGTVHLASPCGKSLAVTFEAILGGFAGLILASWEEPRFVDLMWGKPVTLEEPCPTSTTDRP